MTNDEHLRFPIGRFSNLESYETSETRKNIEQIEALPHHLLKVLEQLSEDELAQSYRQGGWTGNQVVHHIADSHLNCLIRLKLTLTEDNPTIKPYLEERWAELSDYSLPLDSAIDLIRATHFKLSNVLKGLHEEDLRRTYVHPQYQYQRDISYLVALYAWHGNHHVGHLKLLKKS
jgi:uncharacterized damage-inducible protein DinB